MIADGSGLRHEGLLPGSGAISYTAQPMAEKHPISLASHPDLANQYASAVASERPDRAYIQTLHRLVANRLLAASCMIHADVRALMITTVHTAVKKGFILVSELSCTQTNKPLVSINYPELLSRLEALLNADGDPRKEFKEVFAHLCKRERIWRLSETHQRLKDIVKNAGRKGWIDLPYPEVVTRFLQSPNESKRRKPARTCVQMLLKFLEEEQHSCPPEFEKIFTMAMNERSPKYSKLETLLHILEQAKARGWMKDADYLR